MDGPARFKALPDYAFPRLRKLLDAHAPGAEPIVMTIGEPRHPMPDFVGPILSRHVAGFAAYPPNEGTPELLAAISAWLVRRYGVTLGPDRLMVLNGTREGLFNAAVALVPETVRGRRPAVLMPNPFYQVYAVGALAERHDFRILADECYSEVWHRAPPPGILPAAAAAGADPERVLAFHSLSKRSNLPGLRSGFVAGGPRAIALLRQLRSYAGAPLPLPLQRVAEAAWADEAHVEASRALYAAKFGDAAAIFAGRQGFALPEGGFFLWLPVPETQGDGEAAALMLWQRAGVRVLPGAYFGRGEGDANPGHRYLRVALVGDRDETATGLTRLRDALYG